MSNTFYRDIPSELFGGRTYLSSNTSNSTSYTLANVSGFSTSGYVVIGQLGTEQAQLRAVSSISGNELVVSSVISGSYSTGDPVVQCDANKYNILTSTDNATYTELYPSNQDLLVDYPRGLPVSHSAGTSGTYYKLVLYADTVAQYTSSEFRRNTTPYYCSVQEARQRCKLMNNYNVSDAEIEKARDNAASFINGKLAIKYDTPITDDVAMLNQANQDLAAAIIFRTYGNDVQIEAGNAIWESYLGNDGLLSQVVDGKAVLSGTNGIVPAFSTSYTPTGFPDAVYGSTTQKSFRKDLEF